MSLDRGMNFEPQAHARTDQLKGETIKNQTIQSKDILFHCTLLHVLELQKTQSGLSENRETELRTSLCSNSEFHKCHLRKTAL